MELEKHKMNFMDYFNIEKEYFKNVDLNNYIESRFEPSGGIGWEGSILTMNGTIDQAKNLLNDLNEIMVNDNFLTSKINGGVGIYIEEDFDPIISLKDDEQVLSLAVSYDYNIYTSIFKTTDKYISIFDYLNNLGNIYSLTIDLEYPDANQAGYAGLVLSFDGNVHKLTGTVNLSHCSAYGRARFMKHYFTDFDKIKDVEFEIEIQF